MKGCSEVERSSRTQRILGVGMKIRVGSEETGARKNILRGIASQIYSKCDMGLDRESCRFVSCRIDHVDFHTDRQCK